MLNVNPFLHFMILVKIILDKSRASPEECHLIPARRHQHHNALDSRILLPARREGSTEEIEEKA